MAFVASPATPLSPESFAPSHTVIGSGWIIGLLLMFSQSSVDDFFIFILLSRESGDDAMHIAHGRG